MKRVTHASVVAQTLNATEWGRDLLYVSKVIGPGAAARISGHVRALENQIEALEAANPAPEQNPRQR